MRLKFDYFFNLEYLGQYLNNRIQTWHDGMSWLTVLKTNYLSNLFHVVVLVVNIVML